MLGKREPEYYGSVSLDSINSDLQTLADKNNVELDIMQSNAEHELVDRIQHAGVMDFIIINPAAFTHTSVAIRDALASVAVPFIEIHLSNVHSRESFRHKSFFSDLAKGVISGLGPIGYSLALRAAIEITLTSKG
jgi:3-dehydroquinate dehydratase-2